MLSIEVWSSLQCAAKCAVREGVLGAFDLSCGTVSVSFGVVVYDGGHRGCVCQAAYVIEQGYCDPQGAHTVSSVSPRQLFGILSLYVQEQHAM